MNIYHHNLLQIASSLKAEAPESAKYIKSGVVSLVAARESYFQEFFQDIEDLLDQWEKSRTPEDAGDVFEEMQALQKEGEKHVDVDKGKDDVNPEGKPVNIEEGEGPANPEAKEIDLDAKDEPEFVEATPELEGYELENTVQRYVDMLSNALKAQDHGSITKFLRELFNATKANLEEDRAVLAAKRAVRNRLLPVFVRFAYHNPNVRPIFLPYLRMASQSKNK